MEVVKVLAIGDPHIKYKYLDIASEFVEACLGKARDVEPDIIVVLGDILDTHNIVRVQPHKIASRFLMELGKIAKTYLIIGNHDLMNQTEFLSDNHIFSNWNEVSDVTNVEIVDKPINVKIKNFTFTMCPYVSPGRFVEALNTMYREESDLCEMWEFSDCIFCHQEFRGAKHGVFESTIGDEWERDNPYVISGHIHEHQYIGDNIFYTGSSYQHSFNESHKKYIWMVSFERNEEETRISMEGFDLGMKRRITKKVRIEDVESISDISELCRKDDRILMKLKISCSKAKEEVFKKTRVYSDLKENGVSVVFCTEEEEERKIERANRKDYDDILRELIEDDDREEVKKAYEIIKTYLE